VHDRICQNTQPAVHALIQSVRAPDAQLVKP